MKLKDYCIKERSICLASGMLKRICLSPLKPSTIQALCLFGGSAAKVIRGRHSLKVVPQLLQDVQNVLLQSFQKSESNRQKNLLSDRKLNK